MQLEVTGTTEELEAFARGFRQAMGTVFQETSTQIHADVNTEAVIAQLDKVYTAISAALGKLQSGDTAAAQGLLTALMDEDKA